MKYFGAIDQGTTSSRFIVFDETGSIIKQHQQETLKNTTDKEDKIIEQLRWELNLVKKQRDDLLKQLKKIKDIIDAKKT